MMHSSSTRLSLCLLGLMTVAAFNGIKMSKKNSFLASTGRDVMNSRIIMHMSSSEGNMNAMDDVMKLSRFDLFDEQSNDIEIMNATTVSTMDDTMTKISTFLGICAAMLLMTPEASFAQGGAYGIFEGKAASLLHPATMFLLFGTSVYSGILGLKWKRLRELPTEIKAFTDQLPTISSGKASSPFAPEIERITKELAILKGAEDNDVPDKVKVLTSDLNKLQSAASLDASIIKLVAERKDLLAGNYRDKHWLTGSILLSVGVSVSILGAFNTFMRTGRLFPGPHLYAGMGITILWAIAASLVPAMQKGNDTARVAHIGLNTINVALFAWQLVTGFEILLKVWEKAPW